MQLHFVEFAQDFSVHLFGVTIDHLMGQNQKILVKALCYIMEYGSPSHHLLLEECVIRQN
jgi:hypothetical protein